MPGGALIEQLYSTVRNTRATFAEARPGTKCPDQVSVADYTPPPVVPMCPAHRTGGGWKCRSWWTWGACRARACNGRRGRIPSGVQGQRESLV